MPRVIYRVLIELSRCGLVCLLVWRVWPHLRQLHATAGLSAAGSKQRERPPHRPKDGPACRAGPKQCAQPPVGFGSQTWAIIQNALTNGRVDLKIRPGEACGSVFARHVAPVFAIRQAAAASATSH